MGHKRLRIGILTDTDYTPAWAFEMVRMVKELPYVDIPVVITNNDKSIDQRSKFRKVWDRLGIFVTVAYLTLDQKFVKRRNDAFAAKSFKALLSQADWIGISPYKTKFRDRFNDDDLNKIRSYDLDILLCRGFRILSGEILNIPRYGVWSYHHGDNSENRGRPALFYETLENWRTIGTIFQILKEELDNGVILYKSYSGHRSRFIFRNMNSVYWKSSFFFYRCVRELHLKGWDRFISEKEALNPPVNIYDRKLYMIPSNINALMMLINHYLMMLFERTRESYYMDQWHLAFLRKADVTRLSMHRFKVIPIPKDRFWADPFVVEWEGKTYCYFEDYLEEKGRGRISVIEIPEKRVPAHTEAEVVLERDFHLSYPYVFEYKGNLYMIPESAENGTVDLYRCTASPSKFVYVKSLLSNIRALDSTVFFHDGKWWLFANTVPHEEMSSYEELNLYYSDNLLQGEWIAHPRNPIVSDVRSSRPAGNIIKKDGILYRPAQICTPVYGYGINIMRIMKLTETEYQEIPEASIEPKWDKKVRSIHTLSHSGNTVFTDMAIRRRRFL